MKKKCLEVKVNNRKYLYEHNKNVIVVKHATYFVTKLIQHAHKIVLKLATPCQPKPLNASRLFFWFQNTLSSLNIIVEDPRKNYRY